MDELIKAITEPMIAQGAFGITSVIFLGLFLLENRRRERDRKDFDDAEAEMQKRLDKLQEDRVTETRELARIVSEFSHTVQVVLSILQKGAA